MLHINLSILFQASNIVSNIKQHAAEAAAYQN